MNEVRTLAGALGDRFGGNPTQLADTAGFLIRRLGDVPLEAVYVPPRGDSTRPVLTLSSRANRDHYLALALGHHYLRHRNEVAYVYGPDGACFNDGRAAREAQEFAATFLASAPASATRRA